MRGLHRRPVNSPHKGPVTRKMFPFDDVIMGIMEYRTSHYDKSINSEKNVNVLSINLLYYRMANQGARRCANVSQGLICQSSSIISDVWSSYASASLLKKSLKRAFERKPVVLSVLITGLIHRNGQDERQLMPWNMEVWSLVCIEIL